MNITHFLMCIDSVQRAIGQIEMRLSEISDTLSAQSNRSFLGVSWDILLPAFISIFIFLLGYYITGLQSRKKIQKRRQLVKDTIVTWSDSNSEWLEKYVKSIRDLAENIKNSKDLLPVNFPYQHITIDFLSQFNIDRLTDALFFGLSHKIDTKEKGKHLNNYLSSVSYLISAQNAVLENYNSYSSFLKGLEPQWNDKWRAFTSNCELNNFRLHSQQTCPDKNFYLGIVDIEKSILTKESRFADFSIVINKLAESYFDNSTVITDEILETRKVFSELYITTIRAEEIKKYEPVFIHYADSIEQAISQFNNAVNFFREHKIEF